MTELAKKLEEILFKNIDPNDKRAMNKWADIDHLLGHKLADRDIFVTWDRDILKKHKELREQFGIVVQTPEELIRRFNGVTELGSP